MIVEDGTGKVDANSYVDLEFADNYFYTRSVSTWETLANSEKEKLLISATDYVDNVFTWNGLREFENQSLRFPRKQVYDYEGFEIKGIPSCLKSVICDVAILLQEKGSLFNVGNANGNVTSEKIGELSFTYSNDKSTEGKTLYEQINSKLKGLYKEKVSNRIVTGKVRRT